MLAMKVALIEASHWHVPLYLDAIERAGASVVAVSDAEAFSGPAIAARFKSRMYADYRALLDNEEIDFAFAFGRHAAMPGIAHALIDRNIAFAIEKPCGLDAEQVSRLRRVADEKGVYAAVPYIYRGSDLYCRIADAAGTSAPDYNHLSFRFCAGSPDRYAKAGCAWMLNKAWSGGGCTMNLAGHFVDMVHALTGSGVCAVSAVMSDRTHHAGVEDYSAMTLQCANGAVALIETAYTFPLAEDEQREVSFTLSSDAGYLRSGGGDIRVRDRRTASNRLIQVDYETDRYYALFVDTVLREFRSGKRTVTGLPEAEAVMKVIDAAYRSAQAGGALQHLM
jgi:predicted dehydrogenase